MKRLVEESLDNATEAVLEVILLNQTSQKTSLPKRLTLLVEVAKSDKSTWMSECSCVKKSDERKLLPIDAI